MSPTCVARDVFTLILMVCCPCCVARHSRASLWTHHDCKMELTRADSIQVDIVIVIGFVGALRVQHGVFFWKHTRALGRAIAIPKDAFDKDCCRDAC